MNSKSLPITESAREYRDDEINLFDLWDDIVTQKMWVVISIVCCIFLSFLYIFSAVPIYESQIVIKPASANKVVELNVPQLNGIYSKSVDEAYSDARYALLSKEYRRNFYTTYIDEVKEVEGLYSEKLTLEQNFSNFDKLFTLKVSDTKDVETYLKVTLELSDPQKIAELLNAYVDFALASKLADLKETIESKVAIQVQKLEYDAKKLRERYKGDQTRRNLMVTEAYSIAQAVGQTQPVFDKSDILGTYEPPLYMFGTKALKAEEIAIQQRGELAKDLPYGEDHFIDKLPELLFQISELKALEIDYAKVSLAVVDEKAIVPVSPLKPKKLLVVALACVAGMFFGLMLALIVAASNRHKDKTKANLIK